MDNFIILNSSEFEEIIQTINFIERELLLEEKSKTHTIENEKYLTTEEFCDTFHISKRALQNYRDQHLVPYTSIAGKILYPVSEIQKVLDENYCSVSHY